MSPVVTSVNEQSFVEAAAREEQRLDGRRLFDHRKVRVKLGSQNGFVEVELGGTRVMAVVSGTLAAPYADRPSEGIVTLDIVPSPMADPTFEAGRYSEKFRDVRSVLQRAIIRSRAVDTEALCIVTGKLVWNIRIDLKVLDNGGNITDCASIAAVLALHHYRRKDVTFEGDQPVVHDEDTRASIPLTLHHMPLCVSFALLELVADESAGLAAHLAILADPTLLEEKVANGSLVITASGKDQPMLYGIQKYGGAVMSHEMISRVSAMAIERAVEIDEQVIQKALASQMPKRNPLLPAPDVTVVEGARDASKGNRESAGDQKGADAEMPDTA